MKIVASKNNAFNMQQFLKINSQRDYVEGIFVNIAGTNDNQIIIFDFVNNNYAELANVENQNLTSIENSSILSLTEFLDLLLQENITKKIYLNILLSFNIIEYKKIRNYIYAIINIITKYPMFSFYLSSQNQNIISNLKVFDSNYPIGYIVSPSNYIDVDFYIFTPFFLNTKILNEQFKNKKDLMILLTNWTDLQYVIDFFNSLPEKEIFPKELIEKLKIIGEYPEIIYRSLNQ